MGVNDAGVYLRQSREDDVIEEEEVEEMTPMRVLLDYEEGTYMHNRSLEGFLAYTGLVAPEIVGRCALLMVDY